ncbi:hypothetical protein ABTZ03_37220 [Kitasatospora sp. NPDC096077]|uniref:hypothetical protein n=1 Tax=Kitasatospora sp. NPDC096077 TaxID=3155544 RepID=UPI003331699E
MGLFRRNNSDNSSNRHQDSLTDRQNEAHGRYAQLHAARNTAGAAAARAADHGSPEEIARTHANLKQADDAMWSALSESTFWADRRNER